MNPSQPGKPPILLGSIGLAIVLGAVALGFALGRSGPADRPAATVAAPVARPEPARVFFEGEWITPLKLASIRHERAKMRARAEASPENLREERRAEADLRRAEADR